MSHLNLNFGGVHQIFGRNTETSARHLFDGARERYAVVVSVEALAVLAALTSVAAALQFVERQRDGLVSLLADGSERHCRANETLNNVFGRLHLVD